MAKRNWLKAPCDFLLRQCRCAPRTLVDGVRHYALVRYTLVGLLSALVGLVSGAWLQRRWYRRRPWWKRLLGVGVS